ncbi:unnamed protein product [Pieris macdunnoughi]|uniref:Uncharacterized protein n=1 Tax=Pieris macdunnoughi TaxID=345717 RepID=A0A821XQQ4_9NEOP|nr:unnamed protein product [Pieris macdunnoughi]
MRYSEYDTPARSERSPTTASDFAWTALTHVRAVTTTGQDTEARGGSSAGRLTVGGAPHKVCNKKPTRRVEPYAFSSPPHQGLYPPQCHPASAVQTTTPPPVALPELSTPEEERINTNREKKATGASQTSQPV